MSLACVKKMNPFFFKIFIGKYATASTQFRYKGSCNPTIAVSEDKSMIVCWHQEEPFPYECTRPIPPRVEEYRGDLKLKVQHYKEESTKYRPDGPTRRELQNIFHTSKHDFIVKPFRKYDKPMPKKRNSL